MKWCERRLSRGENLGSCFQCFEMTDSVAGLPRSSRAVLRSITGIAAGLDTVDAIDILEKSWVRVNGTNISV